MRPARAYLGRALVVPGLLLVLLWAGPWLLGNGPARKARERLASSTFQRPQDFIFATASSTRRRGPLLASRVWRGRGLRSFIVTDDRDEAVLRRLNAEGAPHGEAYGFVDEGAAGPQGAAPPAPGTLRWSLSPLLAHLHYGDTYKWLLLGDDDTLFFGGGVERLVQYLDAQLPYAVSDAYFPADDELRRWLQHPELCPVCLPCGVLGPYRAALRHVWGVQDEGELRHLSGRWEGCPCTAANVPHVKRALADPHATCRPLVQGGSGVLLSVGLLRQLTAEVAAAAAAGNESASQQAWAALVRCVGDHRASGYGDVMLTRCLWSRGHAFTDTGALLVTNLTRRLFTGDARQQRPWPWCLHGGLPRATSERDLAAEGRCQWLQHNAVSVHVSVRTYVWLRPWRVQAATAALVRAFWAHLGVMDLTRGAERRQPQQAAMPLPDRHD